MFYNKRIKMLEMRIKHLEKRNENIMSALISVGLAERTLAYDCEKVPPNFIKIINEVTENPKMYSLEKFLFTLNGVRSSSKISIEEVVIAIINYLDIEITNVPEKKREIICKKKIGKKKNEK